MVLFYDTVFFIDISSSSQHNILVALFYNLGSSLLYYILYYTMYHILYKKRATQMPFRLGIYKLYNIIPLTAAAVSNNYILFYYIERKKELISF
jgi:hypothetical protein